MTSHSKVYELQPGDALYARRGGNKTYAWYVVDKPSVYGSIGDHDDATRMVVCHREHGAQRPQHYYLADVRHYDRARWS